MLGYFTLSCRLALCLVDVLIYPFVLCVVLILHQNDKYNSMIAEQQVPLIQHLIHLMLGS
jgi:hypothetical protein